MHTKNNYPELSIFDIDDTLFRTSAKVAVVKDGVKIKNLSNKEFNSYVLLNGEEFDFSEFSCANKFFNESTPIEPIFDIVKQHLENLKNCDKSKVIMVTARSNFDSKDRFLETFRKYNLDIDKIRVERAGNIRDIEDISLKKMIIIRNYLRAIEFNQVNFYDDSIQNLTAFLNLKKEFPKSKFNAYLVDGAIVSSPIEVHL